MCVYGERERACTYVCVCHCVCICVYVRACVSLTAASESSLSHCFARAIVLFLSSDYLSRISLVFDSLDRLQLLTYPLPGTVRGSSLLLLGCHVTRSQSAPRTGVFSIKVYLTNVPIVLSCFSPVNCKIILKSAHGAYHICLLRSLFLAVTPALTRTITIRICIVTYDYNYRRKESSLSRFKSLRPHLVFSHAAFSLPFLASAPQLVLAQSLLVNRAGKKLLKPFSTWSYRLECLPCSKRVRNPCNNGICPRFRENGAVRVTRAQIRASVNNEPVRRTLIIKTNIYATKGRSTRKHTYTYTRTHETKNYPSSQSRESYCRTKLFRN